MPGGLLSSGGPVRRIIRALQRHASGPSIGFAGVSGLIVSGITDIASAIKPLVPWLLLISLLVIIALGFLVVRGSHAEEENKPVAGRMWLYCQSMLVALGSGFGALMLLVTANLIGNDNGSTLLALSEQIASGFQRVEERVEDVGHKVEGVDRRVESMSNVVNVRDISGLSGTGMIGDTIAFKVTLSDSSSMADRICKLHLDEPWSKLITTLDDSCERYTLRLPTAPMLNEDGSFPGTIINIPFEITVQAGDGTPIGSFSEVYPFNNNYRDLQFDLQPPGNRLGLDEKRKLVVLAYDEPIPPGLECDVHVYNALHFQPTRDNRCEGWLMTESDPDNYDYKQVIRDGEVRGSLSVQVNSSADFQMIGIKSIDLAIRKQD